HGASRAHSDCRLLITRLFLLIFLIFLFGGFDATILRGLCLGLFHRLLGFGSLLGASFSTLFALFVQNLLAAEKLQERFVRAVTFVPSCADDAGVSPVAIAETRTDRIEQLD